MEELVDAISWNQRVSVNIYLVDEFDPSLDFGDICRSRTYTAVDVSRQVRDSCQEEEWRGVGV